MFAYIYKYRCLNQVLTIIHMSYSNTNTKYKIYYDPSDAFYNVYSVWLNNVVFPFSYNNGFSWYI